MPPNLKKIYYICKNNTRVRFLAIKRFCGDKFFSPCGFGTGLFLFKILICFRKFINNLPHPPPFCQTLAARDGVLKTQRVVAFALNVRSGKTTEHFTLNEK